MAGRVMDPKELSESLTSLSDYIDGHDSPSLETVATALRGMMASLSTRTSADLMKFVGKDAAAAIGALDSIIAKLKKVIKTMNPQDESLGHLNEVLKGMIPLRETVVDHLEDLKFVDF